MTTGAYVSTAGYCARERLGAQRCAPSNRSERRRAFRQRTRLRPQFFSPRCARPVKTRSVGRTTIINQRVQHEQNTLNVCPTLEFGLNRVGRSDVSGIRSVQKFSSRCARRVGRSDASDRGSRRTKLLSREWVGRSDASDPKFFAPSCARSVNKQGRSVGRVWPDMGHLSRAGSVGR